MRLRPGWLPILLACAALAAQAPPPQQAGAGTGQLAALFRQVAAIPRCSGQERGIADWLVAWARARGFEARQDGAGNVLVRVPASPGRERAPAVMLQAHMDMVCERDPGSAHDFARDPIVPDRDGDWLKAAGTTLGADDGAGIALALAVAQDPALSRPPLQLVFTTREETGAQGAAALAPGDLEGRALINLDSEREGTLVIGDAALGTCRLALPLASGPLPGDHALFRLEVRGLQGGHSGIDIQARRGNAIRILARAIQRLRRVARLRLVAAEGGTSLSAIPREASARIAFRGPALAPARRALAGLQAELRAEFGGAEPNLALGLAPAPGPRPRTAFRAPETVRLASFLLRLPNGVAAMDPRFPGVPETSNSLGRLQSDAVGVTVTSLQRGSIPDRLADLNRALADVAAAAGATARTTGPGRNWLTSPDSDLVRACRAAYRRRFGAEPAVSVVHGGLECGVLAAKAGGIEAVSVGPTILAAHSPAERVSLASMERVRGLLAEVLAAWN